MDFNEIVEHLKSTKGIMRKKGLEALQSYLAENPLDADSISTLDTLLRDEQVNRSVKVEILTQFGKVDDDSIIESVKWARHNNQDAKQAYAILEQHFAGDEIDKLILMSQYHFDIVERKKAIQMLSTKDDSRIAPALKEIIRTDSNATPVFRQMAAESLIKIEGADCIPLLTEAIIGGRLAYFQVRTTLVQKRIKFDERMMMMKVRLNAPQEVLDSIDKTIRDNSRR